MLRFVLTQRCFAYRHVATTLYLLQRGFGGRRQHARIQEYLSVSFSSQLILQLTEGRQWKLYMYLYFTKDPEGVHYFPGGVQLFPGGGGVQMLISIETHICTCYFPGGGVRTPYPPLDSHMDNVIITG